MLLYQYVKDLVVFIYGGHRLLYQEGMTLHKGYDLELVINGKNIKLKRNVHGVL
jgi:hypothetical protein